MVRALFLALALLCTNFIALQAHSHTYVNTNVSIHAGGGWGRLSLLSSLVS